MSQPAERERVEALRRGDETEFAALVDEFQPSLRRIVRHYVDSPSVAEEVIQETWLGVIRGIFAFEGRSSLKTWIFRILLNRARTRARREKGTVPLADFAAGDLDDPGVSFDRSNVLRDHGPSPEQALLGAEAQRQLADAIADLPPNLRIVVILRDVEGCSSEEACNILGIRETNQRVLLHRGRSRLRAALEPYLRGTRSRR